MSVLVAVQDGEMVVPKAQGVWRRNSAALQLGGSCPQPWSALSLSTDQAG